MEWLASHSTIVFVTWLVGGVACLPCTPLTVGAALNLQNGIPGLVQQYSYDGNLLTAEELAAVPASRRYLCGFNFALVTLATVSGWSA